MNSKHAGRKPEVNPRPLGANRTLILASAFAVVASFACVPRGRAQSAFIADAWWTFQQDCNGDGCKAGTLPGDFARLNWEPDVTNCDGTLTVFETVYAKPCASGTWTPIYTNPPHSITACRSVGQQHVDLPMASGCICNDYKIEIYRAGQSTPDYVRLGAVDPDLEQHREQLLSEDYCLSDFFASCVSLGGTSGSSSDNNVNATKEPGEPEHARNPGGHSLWYCWTALSSVPVTFDTIGSTFDTVLGVYTGTAVSNLAAVANNDDIAGATNRQSSIQFIPTPGTTYHIAVDGFGGAAGNVVLNWNQATQALPNLIVWGAAAAPTVITRTFLTNGDCEVVEGCATPGTHRLLSFSMETRNIGSGNLEIGDVANNPLFIWANCHKHYHFEHFAQYSLLDTNGALVAAGHKVGFCLMDVHAIGQPGAPTSPHYDCNFQGIQRGWADVYTADLPCQYIDVTTVPPGDYLLQMTVNPDNLFAESRTDDNTAFVPVNIPPIDCTGIAPPNDDFASAISITNTPFSYQEFNSCATKRAGEPGHAGDAGGHSVWFSWTPATNQTAVITTKRSDFDTLLAVYTGNTVSSLSVVASNDDIINGIYKVSQVSFAATAGLTYRIAVDGWSGAVGKVVLNVQPPGNDDFIKAYVLSGTSGTTNGSTLAASKEPNEPSHASDVGGRSLWYFWTAPASGPVDFNTAGSSFDTTLAVYTGTVVTNLTSVKSNDDDIEQGGLVTSRLWFYAVAGTTYRIAVDGFGGDAGDLKLAWNMDSRLQLVELPDGQFRITMTGVDWQRYILLSSTDLATWITNAPAITLSGGLHKYTNGLPFDQQFFRALRTP